MMNFGWYWFNGFFLATRTLVNNLALFVTGRLDLIYFIGIVPKWLNIFCIFAITATTMSLAVWVFGL